MEPELIKAITEGARIIASAIKALSFSIVGFMFVYIGVEAAKGVFKRKGG